MTLSIDAAGLSRGFYSWPKALCIDVRAYAIMSNHYHLVLHINKQALSALDDECIVKQWQMLHHLPEWFDHPEVDENRIAATVALWRERLGSISWFMKSLNEPLAPTGQ